MLSERAALAHIARSWTSSDALLYDNCFRCCRPTWSAARGAVRQAVCPLCRTGGQRRMWRRRRALIAHMRRSARQGSL